ncbi:R8 protein [Coemansia sp. RSA 1813]|nr:R8 protein [Coemansia sp. RSA 1813]
MFYSHELLGRRRGKYSIIWLLATAGSRCKWYHISNKDVAGVDIPRTCADIIQPDTSISLRLASVLLSGLAQALARKSTLLHSECHCTRSRIVSLPWVTGRRGFDPFISSNTTVSSAHLITLPSTYEDVNYAMFSSNDDLSLDIAAGNTASQHSTRSWSSISLPETQPRQKDSDHMDNAYFDGMSPLHNAFSFSLSAGSGDVDNPDTHELPLLKREDDDDRIFFDPSGNLHFASSRYSGAHGHSTDEDVHTELFPTDSPGILAHHIDDNVAIGANQHPFDSEQMPATKDTTASLAHNNPGMIDITQSNEMLDAIPGNTPEIVTSFNSPAQQHISNQGNTEALWETIENAVLQNLPSVACNNQPSLSKLHSLATRQKPSSGYRGYHTYDHSPDRNTFERQIAGMWGDTCIWDEKQSSKTVALFGIRIGKLIGCRVAAASKMYTSGSADVAASLLVPLYPDIYTSEQRNASRYNGAAQSVANEFEGNILEDADGRPLYSNMDPRDDEDIDLELGRGAATFIEPEHLAEEEAILNLRMDIPWLNSDIVHYTRPRDSTSRPMSIRTESSPDIGVRHSIGGSMDSPPSESAALFSEPLIPDDQLDIQQFQLAAAGGSVDQEDTNSRSSASDMDSFLSASHAKHHHTHETASSEGLEPELQSFQVFMIARMKECGKTRVAFSDILIAPYKTRRVAARAFVDILQLATRSVFRVNQENMASEISISLF